MSWVTEGPPSVATRLNPVFPSTTTDGSADFAYRVDVVPTWWVAVENGVIITSGITQGEP